mgnify:CR=1 FL=1
MDWPGSSEECGALDRALEGPGWLAGPADGPVEGPGWLAEGPGAWPGFVVGSPPKIGLGGRGRAVGLVLGPLGQPLGLARGLGLGEGWSELPGAVAGPPGGLEAEVEVLGGEVCP